MRAGAPLEPGCAAPQHAWRVQPRTFHETPVMPVESLPAAKMRPAGCNIINSDAGRRLCCAQARKQPQAPAPKLTSHFGPMPADFRVV